MNKIITLFLILVATFCGVWVFKSKSPINRNLTDVEKVSDWWDSSQPIAALSNEVSSEWYLDPRIPSNYVPVPGEDNLYMQVNEKGQIIQYFESYEEAGALFFKPVNPDIPDSYEPVVGLKDIYKITDENNIVRYVKYVRNPDNSYTFVEVDKYGNVIDEYISTCETVARNSNTVPENYMLMPETETIYGVKNKDGVIVDYKEKSTAKDGTLEWKSVDPSSIDFSKIGRGSASGGSTHGVVTNDPGKQTTIDLNPPKVTTAPVVTTPPVETKAPEQTKPPQGTTSKTKTHTRREEQVYFEIEGDFKVQYKQIVTIYLDDYGNELERSVEGPYEIGREKINQSQKPVADPGLIESNIDNELMRVRAKVQENTTASVQIINALNAERTSQRIATLGTNGDAQKIATLFAADMAIYDNTSTTSPMYGNIEQLLKRYQIPYNGCGINVWRAVTADGTDVHKRFQSIDSSRTTRMSDAFNQVGVAVFEKDGYSYIAEILLKQ